jgi:putative GTP pyrophosphokinase
MGVQKDFDNEYDRLTAPLKDFGEATGALLETFLEQDQIKFHTVVYRVKSRDSAERKLARKAAEEGTLRSAATLTDLLGIRVITYFRDEVDAVAKVIEREFIIDPENSVDKRSVLDADRFGYLSLHYVAELSPRRRPRLPEYPEFSGIKFEIQIRSILQHAWAEIEHDLGYKTEAAVPRAVRRRFSRLAGVLELADDEFLGLREGFSRSQDEARRTIARGALKIEIDQDSLFAFVQSSRQVTELDGVVARLMNCSVQKRIDREFIGRQAEQLVRLGFGSVQELSEYLGEHQRLLEKFIGRWLSLTEHAPRGGRAAVPVGIILYYAGMLRYTQGLLEGKEVSDAYPSINTASLVDTLVTATDDAAVRPAP